MLRAHPVVLALCVLAVGFVLIWVGLNPFAGDPFLFCPDAPQEEGSSYRVEPALWPPGTTRCEYTTSSGASSRIYVPWRDWAALLLLAAAVGVAWSRPLLGVVLFLAAFAAEFGVVV